LNTRKSSLEQRQQQHAMMTIDLQPRDQMLHVPDWQLRSNGCQIFGFNMCGTLFWE
jgi:hypothetical protein